MKRIKKLFTKEEGVPHSWRRAWIAVLIVVIVIAIFAVGFVAYAKTYSQKVLPGVHIGSVPVGGLDADQVKDVLQEMSDKLIAEGITFSFGQPADDIDDLILYPILVSESNSLELVEIDLEAEVEHILNYGKDGNILNQGMKAFTSRMDKPRITLEHIAVDVKRTTETIADHVRELETEPKDASVVVASVDPLVYEVVSSSEGLLFTYDDIDEQIKDAWSTFDAPKIHIDKVVVKPSIHEDTINGVTDKLGDVFAAGKLSLTYKNPRTGVERLWNIRTNDIQKWIELQQHDNGELVFGLSPSSTYTFLEEKVSPLVDIEAQNAKFKMNEYGRVVEFQGSSPGIGLVMEDTYNAINDALLQRNWHDEGLTNTVAVVFEQTEPEQKTGDVNDLGIEDVLGVGLSDFSGSPRNRIKNIQNALYKLNGVIIDPGEEFSAIQYTQPYTVEGGYLPELVIKGDEIKPEIGGGLCQVGTTLFRMAMNSGMEITQRRNHSLVVNYYNDPTNGLPGTDATIYDPQPDFKFRNDTGHHILLQTDVNWDTMELVFTLWGTSDGREASYTAPVVHRWIPYGETKIVETTKIEPGEKECQHAYRGAEASFTYTRVMPGGETEERVFESYYRPLPQICLVGIEKESDGEEDVDSDTVEESDEPAGEVVGEEII